MTTVFELLLITILPSLFLLIYFIKLDKYPEPTPIIILTVLLGIIICFPAGYLNSLLIQQNDSLDFLAAITEEPLKFLILYFFIRKRNFFNEPMDGIVYGVCVSLGFATYENFDYVFNHSESFAEAFWIAGIRSFSAVPLHALCGAIMGYHFGQYVFEKQKHHLFLSLLIPIAFHAIYNFSAGFHGLYYLIVILIMLIYFFKIKKKVKQ
jgi:RsiW-degrading membrane proteinase PrsW (M82 family)